MSSTLDAPICVGITGDICLTCKQRVYDTHKGDPEATADCPLYVLNCHTNDELICRDCLVRSWQAEQGDDSIPCPWTCCRKNTGFATLPKMGTVPLDRDLLERVEHYRFRKEFVEHPISVSSVDAQVLLREIYELYADQILDATALGGRPGHVTDKFENSAIVSMGTNPFFAVIYGYFSNNFAYDFPHHLSVEPKVAKFAMTTSALEVQLTALLDSLMRKHIVEIYGWTLQSLGKDLCTDEGIDEAVQMAMEQFLPLRTVHENWTGIIFMLVNLLCYRHLERFGGLDDENISTE